MSARRSLTVALLAAACLLPACRQKMADQPSYRPLQATDFFEDGRASRPRVAGTVARGQLGDSQELLTGKSGDEFVLSIPVPVDRAFLERGRERYGIFCTPCHDAVGNGQGMVVQRGYPAPPSLHIDRLRAASPGSLYDVITRGFGRMPRYASQIPVRDRWAIVAWMRVLQLSQQAGIDDVPAEERTRLLAEEGGS